MKELEICALGMKAHGVGVHKDSLLGMTLKHHLQSIAALQIETFLRADREIYEYECIDSLRFGQEMRNSGN